jgi:hypothetical protein
MGNVNSSINNEKDPLLIIQKFTKDNIKIFEEIFKKITDNKLEDDVKILENKMEENNVITDDTLSNSCTVDNNKGKRIKQDTKQLNKILKRLQKIFRDKFTYKREREGGYVIELLSIPYWVDNKINYTDIYDFLNKIKPYMNAFITYSRVPFSNCSVLIKRLLGKYEEYDNAKDYRGQYRIFKKILIEFIKENYCVKKGRIYTSSNMRHLNATGMNGGGVDNKGRKDSAEKAGHSIGEQIKYSYKIKGGKG